MMLSTEYLAETSRSERLDEIARLDLDNMALRVQLQDVVQRSAEKTGHPVSMINIILDNAQWTIASHGLSPEFEQMQGLPAEWSFCVRVVVEREACLATDAAADHRFDHNPLVGLNLISSYAGVPLTMPSGEIIGTHCVIDGVPQACTSQDIEHLQSVSHQISDLIDRYHRPEASARTMGNP